MLLSLLLLLATADTARTPAAAPASVVLISIDGLRPDQVRAAAALGLNVPHLRALAARGASGALRGVLPTVTYPSHTTLLTGATPAHHGVVANTTFDPLGRNLGGWYWYAEDVKVLTLWDAVQRAGRSSANVHWPVSVGAAPRINLPQIWRTGTPDDRKLIRALATPGVLSELEHAVGAYPDGIDESIEADEARTKFALRLIADRKPALLTIYFASLDHEAHRHGWRSAEAKATLERLDALVGKLDDAATAAYGAAAVVAVVSDHGFADVAQVVNMPVALRAAGLMQFASDTATAPTGWDVGYWPSGGTAAFVLRDGAPADAAGRALALLDSLARTPGTGIKRVLSPAKMTADGGFPDTIAGVEFADGFYSGLGTKGPLVSPASYAGMHGFHPDNPEMAATLILAGRGVPAGRALGLVDMRVVAPTLARLLDVPMATELPGLPF